MNFVDHSDLAGSHAFLSASKYHWINYTPEKLEDSYKNFLATQRGTELHAFASQAIKLGIKLTKNKKTLNMYVNDGIGFKMTTEQPLFYSYNAYGTADTICFRDQFLRIHDFKSGVTRASMSQLEVYVALFCLEYDIDPSLIGIELRIYQSDDILISIPKVVDIVKIMDTIVTFDKQIERLKLLKEE